MEQFPTAILFQIMGAVMGYGGALQVPCLAGFDSHGLHQLNAIALVGNTKAINTSL
jgi:hypothetical protein